ncbi:hypothetical protein [Burkholderia sp. WSM2230]|uniref:hypothetical protein n=1 Tax=Burkholderia sp. WSM2230 TaxID=944435 RepID=UPI000A00055E|nr:hypothetical protein [Burkholderia sp. WSM2230]
MTVSGKEGRVSEQLWCVHIEGPDDFIAADSRDAAEREASAINAYIEGSGEGHSDAPVRAVAMEWPFTPESHARALESDWEDLQRMPHRKRQPASSQSILTNIARRVKELIEVARGT